MPSRILFVEDDQSPRKAFASLLRKNGYDVREADNGRSAIQLLGREPLDLLITDMIMPEMDGVQTIMAVRNCYPDIKIIAVAEHGITSAEDSLKIARALGSHKALIKPFGLEELLNAIRELIG